MREREPGSEPQVGDRVQFVIVHGDFGASKQFEKSEDPNYAKMNNIKLDYNYYFTNKFVGPIGDLLEPLVKGANIFGDLTQYKPSKWGLPEQMEKSQKSIKSFFTKK
jgi:DNA polymerase delta subunit 1